MWNGIHAELTHVDILQINDCTKSNMQLNLDYFFIDESNRAFFHIIWYIYWFMNRCSLPLYKHRKCSHPIYLSSRQHKKRNILMMFELVFVETILMINCKYDIRYMFIGKISYQHNVFYQIPLM